MDQNDLGDYGDHGFENFGGMGGDPVRQMDVEVQDWEIHARALDIGAGVCISVAHVTQEWDSHSKEVNVCPHSLGLQD